MSTDSSSLYINCSGLFYLSINNMKLIIYEFGHYSGQQSSYAFLNSLLLLHLLYERFNPSLKLKTKPINPYENLTKVQAIKINEY